MNLVSRMRTWSLMRARALRLLLSAATVPLVWMWSTGMAFAANPTVNYGTSNTQLSSTVTTTLESVATTIRDVLGATALVVILVAALTNHFVHDQRSKDRAKEMIVAAIVGLLLAAFAPAIVNWIASL